MDRAAWRSGRLATLMFRRILIFSATVRDGRSLCVPHDDWDRLDEGDRLPIVAVTSALGREVALAPGAFSHVTKEPQ